MYARDEPSACGSALEWYRKAAGNAQAAAMYELGKLYQTVCGPDPDRAFVWFQIGARFGSTGSRAEADKISSQLNDVKRKKADAAVEAWIARHSGARKEADDD
jgi:TPR repeat protein